MPKLEHEGLERLVRASVNFARAQDLDENPERIADKIKVGEVTRADFYVIGPGENKFLCVDIGRPWGNDDVISTTIADGFVHVVLSSGVAYEIHQHEASMPRDLTYTTYDINTYQKRYKELLASYSVA